MFLIFKNYRKEFIPFRKLGVVKKQGMKVVEGYKVCSSADEVWQAIVEIGESCELEYDIDGAVKVDDLADRVYLEPPRYQNGQWLTNTTRGKRNDCWSCLSVGEPVDNPTAIFDPIRLGNQCGEGNLHNQDRIDELDLRIVIPLLFVKQGRSYQKKVVKEKDLKE